MRIRVHRGAHEVGGNCVEFESVGHSILLDLGLPLVEGRSDPPPLRPFLWFMGALAEASPLASHLFVRRGRRRTLQALEDRRFVKKKRSRRVSIECLAFRTLLVGRLYRHDLQLGPPYERGKLGICKLFDVAIVRAAVLDRLHSFALQAIGDHVEGPAFAIERAAHKFLGQLVDLLALHFVARIDSVQFETQRIAEYLHARPPTRIA